MRDETGGRGGRKEGKRRKGSKENGTRMGKEGTQDGGERIENRR